MSAESSAAKAAETFQDYGHTGPARPETERTDLDAFPAAAVVAHVAGIDQGVQRENMVIYMIGRLFPDGLDTGPRDESIRKELERQHPQLKELDRFGLAALSANVAPECQAQAKREWAERETKRLGFAETITVTSLCGATQRWVNAKGKPRFYAYNNGRLVQVSRKGAVGKQDIGRVLN